MKELEELPRHELALAEMSRAIDLMDAKYRGVEMKLEEARLNDALDQRRISNVNLVQPATLVEKPISPKKVIVGASALFVALTAGFCIAFLAEIADPTLRTIDQTESRLELPVVSSLPRLRRGLLRVPKSKEAARGEVPKVSAAMRSHCESIVKRLILGSSRREGLGRVVGVLSCDKGDGGSTLASAIALIASRDLGLSTLLVDADHHEGFVGRTFALNGAPGLCELVTGQAESAHCLRNGGKLTLLSCGSLRGQNLLDLDPRAVGRHIRDLESKYELVVVDLPSANDGIAVASTLDSIILVMESERTRVNVAQRMCDQLLRSDAKVWGIVLNKTHDYVPRWLDRFI